MRVIFSKTGSQGNCSVIESEDGELLTIDAGIKYDIVNRAIGYKLHMCKVSIITHKHADHCLYLRSFTTKGMKLYAPIEVIKKPSITKGLSMMETIHDKRQFEVPGFKILPIAVEHWGGSRDICECYGFLIQDVSVNQIGAGDKMLWVTDAKDIPYRFPPLEHYCIEANYWEQDDYFEDIDYVEPSVELRRFRSHMSVETAVDFLKKQDLSKCREIRFLHISNSMTQEQRDNIIPYTKNELGKEDLNVVI